MAKNKYEDIQNLKKGSYDSKIIVRVIRFWRGVSLEGEEFKGFNVILLDKKNYSIHAFVPALCAYDLERKLKVGNVCIITNFSVQPYKMTDKFRSVRNDNQLIFSKNTTIEDIDDTGSNISSDWFDLYAHTDLKPLSQQNIYLADVVGIIKDHLPFNMLKNKHGKTQGQARFLITDGSSSLKVTFWDKFGEYFEKGMKENIEKPVIILIASCRVGVWNDEINLSNVAATKFYLNYKHRSVMHLRKMLAVPAFYKKIVASNYKHKAVLFTLQELLEVDKEYIDKEVLIHVNIKKVEEAEKWYYQACTSCLNKTEEQNGNFSCIQCNKNVPYPEMKFKLSVLATDGAVTIQIILDDREVRRVIGKRANELIQEEDKEDFFPPEVKRIAQKDYTIKIEVRDCNVDNRMRVYWATNICPGFVVEVDDMEISQSLAQPSTQHTTSTMQIDEVGTTESMSTTSQDKGKQVA